jgi:hypothetical protein
VINRGRTISRWRIYGIRRGHGDWNGEEGKAVAPAVTVAVAPASPAPSMTAPTVRFRCQRRWARCGDIVRRSAAVRNDPTHG